MSAPHPNRTPNHPAVSGGVRSSFAGLMALMDGLLRSTVECVSVRVILPLFTDIRKAGHEGGDFLFIPSSTPTPAPAP